MSDSRGHTGNGEKLYIIERDKLEEMFSLLKLNLEECEGVTAEAIQAMVKNCTSLREINLKRCQVNASSLNSIVSSSSSLRRVFPPSSDGFHDSLSGFSMHNGCLVSSS
ncbi:hypothetical protein RND71_029519 [Anisodus tanguticus]|uniref:Uncharacterized protein n=1 Tax=Anisodus tanguticus TaxID=243964 RepID=A0AAE1RE68_9SOLA|nr:hypothetical protein RND71_029519 [Anisodus tanguticus]